MPVYVYVNEQDETDVVEKIYPASKFKPRRRFKGKWYVISTALQAMKPKRTRRDQGYPFYSFNLGTTPNQIEALQEVFQEAGLTRQEFNEMGDVKVTGPGHRKQLIKARGMVDRNSYTGY